MSKESVFQPEFREDLRYWIETDRKTALRIFRLIEEVLCNPHQGIGKPEPLKFLGAGVWSRRITQEHRLVYVKTPRIRDDEYVNWFETEDHREIAALTTPGNVMRIYRENRRGSQARLGEELGGLSRQRSGDECQQGDAAVAGHRST